MPDRRHTEVFFILTVKKEDGELVPWAPDVFVSEFVNHPRAGVVEKSPCDSTPTENRRADRDVIRQLSEGSAGGRQGVVPLPRSATPCSSSATGVDVLKRADPACLEIGDPARIDSGSTPGSVNGSPVETSVRRPSLPTRTGRGLDEASVTLSHMLTVACRPRNAAALSTMSWFRSNQFTTSATLEQAFTTPRREAMSS